MTLDEVVRDLAPKLLGYCRLETADASLADEVAQDALTALVLRWRRFGPPESPAAFVFAIARRRAARLMVRQRLLAPLDAVLGGRDARRSPEQQALASDGRARVVKAMSRLRPRDRQILLLLVVWETGMDGAARMLGISVSAAKMRASRARLRLRELLEEDEGDAFGRARSPDSAGGTT